MRRTGPTLLLVAAILGAGVGFVLDQLLTAGGAQTFTPALPLAFLLLALAAVVVALAIPIRRVTRGQSAARLDPFHALRIAMLAKASSIVGAVVGGFAAGLLLFLLTRPIQPSVDSVSIILFTLGSGGVLIAAGLIAEQMCMIRKDDDDDEQPGGDGPGAASFGG